jgi:hypothetical protein
VLLRIHNLKQQTPAAQPQSPTPSGDPFIDLMVADFNNLALPPIRSQRNPKTQPQLKKKKKEETQKLYQFLIKTKTHKFLEKKYPKSIGCRSKNFNSDTQTNSNTAPRLHQITNLQFHRSTPIRRSAQLTSSAAATSQPSHKDPQL